MSRESRKRLRYGMGISLEEYCSNNIGMVRQLQSELITLTSGGYIGYFDTWDKTIRILVFERCESRDKALEIARSIGFSSSGKIDGEVFVSNMDLQRTHLQHIRSSDQFYREYYR